jgi:fido (protein-threonine AMPylation protein)
MTQDDRYEVFGLSEAYVELVLIHPFREGNGRVSRMLAGIEKCSWHKQHKLSRHWCDNCPTEAQHVFIEEI